jgi:hypothetical protein
LIWVNAIGLTFLNAAEGVVIDAELPEPQTKGTKRARRDTRNAERMAADWDHRLDPLARGRLVFMRATWM